MQTTYKLNATAEQAVCWTANQREMLGKRLREAREKKGLTAVEAAKYLGYRQNTHVAVTRLERNVLGYVRADHVVKLAKLYEVELASLLPKDINVQAVWQDAVRLDPTLDAPNFALAQRLREYRMQHALSEKALAERITETGPIILASDIKAWESGQKEPNPVQLRALERILGAQVTATTSVNENSLAPQRRWVFGK